MTEKEVLELIEQAAADGRTALAICGCRLTELPAAIGELSSLRQLYLSGNQLTELPKSLEELKDLRALYLHWNEGLGLPAEVVGATWVDVVRDMAEPAKPADILDYYFRLRGG